MGRPAHAAMALLLAVMPVVFSDLPVHCPHSVVVGKWKFHSSEHNRGKGEECTSGKGVNVCSYGSCFDSRVLGDPNYKVDESKGITVELVHPNIAKTPDGQTGTWTSVYDEGFEVKVGGRTYFAFSKFKDGSGEANAENSVCDKTFPGWHSETDKPDAKTWGCFHAEKMESAGSWPEKTATLAKPKVVGPEGKNGDPVEEEMDMDAGQQEEEGDRKEEEEGEGDEKKDDPILLETSESESESESERVRVAKHGISKEQGEVIRNTPYVTDHGYLRKVNDKATRWTAVHYPHLEGLSLLEIHQRMGSSQTKPGGHVRHLSTRDTSDHDYSLLQIQAAELGLPKTFDWRNKDGKNYMDKVINQECGSCYTASTTSMINSRMRIQSNLEDKPELDYHQILNCDRYNQGCAGGYPFLVEKHAHDFGLTESGKCPPKAVDPEVHGALRFKSLRQPKGGASLGPQDDAADVAAQNSGGADIRVKEFSYIGGYYGAGTAHKMMQEIYQHGPITVGIGGSLELLHYKAGVFHHTGADHHIDWAPVNHAVVIAGWETDKANKMNWIVKNSYGADWGEGGYFKIGIDGQNGKGEQNVNTLTSWAKPERIGRK